MPSPTTAGLWDEVVPSTLIWTPSRNIAPASTGSTVTKDSIIPSPSGVIPIAAPSIFCGSRCCYWVRKTLCERVSRDTIAD